MKGKFNQVTNLKGGVKRGDDQEEAVMSNGPSLPGEGDGTPLQYSCLENPMDSGPGRLQSMGSLRVGHN